jgi:sugar fermentation stimulation protein A
MNPVNEGNVINRKTGKNNLDMEFEKPLIHGLLINRYKRFLVNVRLDSGEEVVAHCTNTGSMKSCLEPGAEVCLSPAGNPNRSTKYTWEMIKIGGNWVGINTSNPNKLAYQAVMNGEIEGLKGYTTVRREVTFGDSRFDLYAENEKEKCFIEVKNVTLKEGQYALFPDAVSTRGQKHLEALIKAKKEGFRAVMLYIIQRLDVDFFGPARDIDPEYAKALEKAVEAGIEVFPVQVLVMPEKLSIIRVLPFEI